MFESYQGERLLFVWDGMQQSVGIADHVLVNRERMAVSRLHVLPHESIYACATPSLLKLEPMAYERSLHAKFGKVNSSTKRLSEAKLELVFGDRISEIARCAQVVRAKFILMPKFQQSQFSIWIHGDLNRRMTEKADCPLLLYDSNSEAWSAEQPRVDRDENSRL